MKKANAKSIDRLTYWAMIIRMWDGAMINSSKSIQWKLGNI